MANQLAQRHIQDFHGANNVTHHWGYADRIVPCKNDAGSCQYLDQVYAGHDLSIKYSWIMWLVIAAIALIWLAVRFIAPRNGYTLKTDGEAGSRRKPSFLTRVYGSANATRRRYLLPESLGFLGRVSRLQLTVLAILSAYLIIFTFVGMQYRHWITPVKNSTKKNTRSTLGPWSDRIGILAYALTPVCVALSTRESVLSLVTGIPYQHFMFLHRWTGRIIYIQSALHTIGWTIIEAKLYQPQPKVYRDFIRQQYMVFGCVAMLFVTFLFVFSFTAVIRRTGFEFFRKAHYLVALLYIAACIGHWQQLWPYLVPAFVLFFADRGVRLLRTLWIHLGRKDPVKGFGFHYAQAQLTTFSDAESAVARLEFEFQHSPWQVGQQFHLCFPSLTIWQSHPMTPASMPSASQVQKHVYIIRAMKGETARLAALAVSNDDSQSEKSSIDKSMTVPVILNGPSGGALFQRVGSKTPANVLAIAGGTGVSFALPAVEEAISRAHTIGAGAVDFVWVIRKTRNVEWIAPELASLRERLVADKSLDLEIHIFITRDSRPSPSGELTDALVESEKPTVSDNVLPLSHPSSHAVQTILDTDLPGLNVTWLNDHHPQFAGQDSAMIDAWLERGAVHGGTFHVFASGPAAMGSDLRRAVARRNDAAAVWRGQSQGDVEFYWDDRGS